MQTVSAAFTAEEKDKVRSPAGNLLVSWKKQTSFTNRTFTIGVSTIGGNDVIGANPGAIGSPGNYRYFDESDYLLSLAWERGLNLPTGGLTKGLAEADIENTSGRFTPRYMGGNSELFTAILPRRPFIINAGFNRGGVEDVIPQFAGILTRQPEISVKERQVRLIGADYTDFFQNKFLDQEVMFTAQRTDLVLASLMNSIGLTTAQYDFDTGINLIPFGLFEKGTKFSSIIHELVEAENGHFYQDESGIFKFESRQHWNSSPYTQVQRLVLTGQVIEAEGPDTDHLINVVEIKGGVLQKQPSEQLFKLSQPLALPAGTNTELFVNFDNPVLQLDTVSFYVANTNSDESGDDLTSQVVVHSVSTFAKAVKIVFINTSDNPGYLTQLSLYGRVVKKVSDLYVRAQDDSSVTAYEERLFSLDNDYIQNSDWASTYAQMILNDFSSPENLQKIKIRAMPELQLGDLVSWQGRYWRIFNIRAMLSASEGFTQELTLLQRTITSYFRIGISTIGGTDRIAP